MNRTLKVIAALMLMMTVIFATAYVSYDKTSAEEDDCVSGVHNGHEYVDLGLPSGTRWATCNVGATKPEGYGEYFAWGETYPKVFYDWKTYKYSKGHWNQLTKYCLDSIYGYNGFTDNLSLLQKGDDVAYLRWGEGWSMPTAGQCLELVENTSSKYAIRNGVEGRLLTASNGNSLFMPFAGSRLLDMSVDLKSDGDYWSCSLYSGNSDIGWELRFGSSTCNVVKGDRYFGRTVRPVCSAK